ncbi:hypothetical protein F8M41_000454 [Gigaspora margarita]|uniref:Uncharacterized protein n=1 Tax=Gigaspora margarita TaxID=4874 RepID=A0A8H4A9U8_GIGMA|nr:hypothetical protein F8M41_000454 [Gigaspora margarita]
MYISGSCSDSMGQFYSKLHKLARLADRTIIWSYLYSIPKPILEQQQKFYSDSDIDKLVEEQIASIEKQKLASEKHIFEAKPKQVPKADSNAKTIRQFIEIIKQAKKTLAKKARKADRIHIDHFLDEVLENIDNKPDSIGFHDDINPVEDMRKQLENLHINQNKIAKAIKKIFSKPKSSYRKTKSKSKTKKKEIIIFIKAC